MKILKMLLVVLTVVTIMNFVGVSASSIYNVDTITNLFVPKGRGSNTSPERYIDTAEMGRHHKLKEISISKPLDVRVQKYGSATEGWMGSTWYDIYNKTSITLTYNTYLDIPFYMQGGTFRLEFRTRGWELFNANVNKAVWYLQI